MQKQTYLAFDGVSYKIGQSIDAVARIEQHRTSNPKIRLLSFGYGISEKELHSIFEEKRIVREWFLLSTEDVVNATELIESKQEPDQKEQDNFESEDLSVLYDKIESLEYKIKDLTLALEISKDINNDLKDLLNECYKSRLDDLEKRL